MYHIKISLQNLEPHDYFHLTIKKYINCKLINHTEKAQQNYKQKIHCRKKSVKKIKMKKYLPLVKLT